MTDNKINLPRVSVSTGNIKMGKIPSISLPPIVTCSAAACATCGKKCYAKKICRYSKEAAAAYNRNLDILKNEPARFWNEVDFALKGSRFFRFNVSGDIYNKDYFEKLCEVVKNNKHCECLIFTKKYDIVNDYLKSGKKIPKNLHVLFSGWIGIKMENPFRLPEAHVIFKNGETSARDGAKYCSGNCFECALNCGGCWSMKKGEQVLFREH